MTQATGISLAIAVIYMAVTTGISIRSARQNKDAKTFFHGNMNPFVVGVLLMSEFLGTGSTMGTAQTAFGVGISAAWNLLTLGLAFFLFAYFMAPKFQELGDYTISGAMAKRYGKKTRMVVSLIMIYALMVVSVSMYTGGGATISTLLNIPSTWAIIILALISSANVALGGIKGVGASNMIHASFKYLGLIIVAVVGWRMAGGYHNIAVHLPPKMTSWTGAGWPTILAWTLGNIGAIFCTQYTIQAIVSLKNPSDAKKASLYAAVFMIPVGLLASFIGVSAKFLFPKIQSVNAMPWFLKVMDPWWGGLVVAGLLAATLVSVLASQLGVTALVMKDFYTPIFKPSEDQKLNISRIISVVVGLVPIPFSLFMPGILKTIFFARALRTSISVVAVCMFYLPFFSSDTGAATGLVVATAGASIWFFLGNPFGIDNIYVAAVLPLIVMIIDHIVFAAKRRKQTPVAEKAV